MFLLFVFCIVVVVCRRGAVRFVAQRSALLVHCMREFARKKRICGVHVHISKSPNPQHHADAPTQDNQSNWNAWWAYLKRTKCAGTILPHLHVNVVRLSDSDHLIFSEFTDILQHVIRYLRHLTAPKYQRSFHLRSHDEHVHSARKARQCVQKTARRIVPSLSHDAHTPLQCNILLSYIIINAPP